MSFPPLTLTGVSILNGALTVANSTNTGNVACITPACATFNSTTTVGNRILSVIQIARGTGGMPDIPITHDVVEITTDQENENVFTLNGTGFIGQEIILVHAVKTGESTGLRIVFDSSNFDTGQSNFTGNSLGNTGTLVYTKLGWINVAGEMKP